MNVPVAWAGNIQEWIRQAANALNLLISRWPSLLVSGVLGYSAGGAVTQATNKSTAVTLDTVSGQITMNAASLAATTGISFTLNNSNILANDLLLLNHASGGTLGNYVLQARCAAGSASIHVYNRTGGALAEAVVIGFAIIRAANA